MNDGFNMLKIDGIMLVVEKMSKKSLTHYNA